MWASNERICRVETRRSRKKSNKKSTKKQEIKHERERAYQKEKKHNTKTESINAKAKPSDEELNDDLHN